MSANIDLVSIIMPVCNQGDEARQTVASARDAIGDLPHEIILVDDHSTDGSCHGMPHDVLIVRTERREGVSSARRAGFAQSRGDILIWSDPHCRFPRGSLRHLARVAAYKDAIVEPCIVSKPGARPLFGGKLEVAKRGLRVGRALERPAPFPALYGTVYAMKRSVYERLGGWPKLPGIWGCSEQALTLMSWFLGVPVYVERSYTCRHKSYQPERKFPFSVRRADPAWNAHFVHAAFFPKTYESYWRPILERRFGRRDEHLAPLQSPEFQRLRRQIKRRSVRDEDDFFPMVLGMDAPRQRKTGLTDEQYVRQQAQRSKPGRYKSVQPRVDAAFRWMRAHMPADAIAGKRALDLGTRDGYGVEVLQGLGAARVEGVELVPETAASTAARGLPVRQGDMRRLSDPDGSWDLVTSLHSLEHCPEPERAVREMFRVLRPGGWLFVVVPREETPGRDGCHNCAFPTEQSLVDLVLASGSADASSVRTDVGVLARGHRELRLVVRKSVPIFVSGLTATDTHSPSRSPRASNR